MRARFDFYHLHARSAGLEEVVARLALKALEGSRRVLVMAASPERLKALDSALWTFEANSWLPHGSAFDGPDHAADQPVYLATEPENPNGAQFLFLTEGTWREDAPGFERVFVLFDERDADALDRARGLWKTLKDQGFPLHYWQQVPLDGDPGRRGWREQASANLEPPAHAPSDAEPGTGA
ncbi:DNA polymerase III subunit chi [Phaeovibrio sulfidiphilus]|uniref:DNA polymerase III subunit chi n=1 Tax=Phaeovibrio sulfidiphilus TaxID=1220600 RepID=A0A8J6YKD7_9PROT|nr:DNA polymerase III subunit chi [Phaeovibrio sulfidiphilus]MBE1236130.1 DNA polymerase III subunit chi [Phaeovibrio sulfidiphilus]